MTTPSLISHHHVYVGLLAVHKEHWVVVSRSHSVAEEPLFQVERGRAGSSREQQGRALDSAAGRLFLTFNPFVDLFSMNRYFLRGVYPDANLVTLNPGTVTVMSLPTITDLQLAA